MTQTRPEDRDDLLSIGRLAERTGIAPDTIRVWERRYGKPRAVRLPSGHRRYTETHVRWLRRVAEALAMGHRTSEVVALSERKLDALLAEGEGEDGTSGPVQRLLGFAGSMDVAHLRRALLADAKKLEPRHFLRNRVAPFLTALGRAWADGEISVRHEHLAAEVVEDTLRQIRNQYPKPRRGPSMVLTTLPGEEHGLGLQIVALECALAGVRVRLLGPAMPLEEIVEAAIETRASAVGISISLATGGVKTDRLLAELRGDLPKGVRLLVGGAGARGVRRGPQGVEYAPDAEALEEWLEGLVSTHQSRRG